MHKEKKPHHPKPLTIKFLQSLEEEDPMHDDHGPVIIGLRSRKPNIREEEEEKKQKRKSS